MQNTSLLYNPEPSRMLHAGCCCGTLKPSVSLLAIGLGICKIGAGRHVGEHDARPPVSASMRPAKQVKEIGNKSHWQGWLTFH